MSLQGIVLVAGIPGVGKTTFIQQLKETSSSSSSSYHWIVWAYDELVKFDDSLHSFSSVSYRRYLYQLLEHVLLVDKEDLMNNNNNNPSRNICIIERVPDDHLLNRQLIEERLRELKNSK